MPQPTNHRRWTEDTGLAFLLALRLTGQVRLAAAEIGRDKTVCYQARARDPELAAKWDAILAEQAARRRTARADARARQRAAAKIARRAVKVAADEDAAAAAVERDASGNRTRWSGLNPVKRRAFLRGLSESGTVEAACRTAGVSDTAAYNLRQRDADFAAAWDRALRTSGPALEQIAWERAVEGWEEPVFAGGKQVGTRWRHSPGLLQQMIGKREKAAALADDPKALRARAEEAARAAGGWFAMPADREETNAAILKALKAIEGRRAPFAEPPAPPGADTAADP